MEAERLHDVVLDVLADYETHNIPGLLTNLASYLQASASSPNPQQADQFLQGQQELYSALDASRSNRFAPSRERILASIGASNLAGRGLRTRVDTLLIENQLTPGKAVEQLQLLGTQAAQLLTALKGVTKAFERFKIGMSDSLNLEECEVGALLPSSIIGNSLESFGQGLRDVDKHLRPFAELVGAEAGSWKIRSLSSGSLDIFTTQNLAVAVVLAKAFEWLQERYKAHLETKVLAAQLAERKAVTAQTLKRIEDDDRESQKTDIRAFAAELVKQHYRADKRGKDGNEMANYIALSLRYLLDCTDHNADFEVTPPQSEATPGEENEAADPRVESITLIAEKGTAMRLLEPRKAPVLALPPAEDLADEKPEKKK